MSFRYPLEKQKADKICWAAVAASVDHYFALNSPATQCSVASAVFGQTCCTFADQIPDVCNRVHYLENALSAVNRFEPPTSAALTFTDIVDLINKRMPICVRIQWRNGSGHFVVITGYRQTADGHESVEISDPWHENVLIPFAEFSLNYRSEGRPNGGGTWSHTYPVRSR